MSYIIIPSRRTRQPLGPVRLNLASWLLNGVYDVWGAHNYWTGCIFGRQFSIPTTATQEVTPEGLLFTKLNGSSSLNMTGVSGLNSSTSPRSSFVLCRTGATKAAFDVAFTADSASFQGLRLQTSSTGNSFQASDGQYNAIGGTAAINTTYGLGAANTGGLSDYLYVNGVLAGQETSNAAAAQTLDRLYVGGYKGQDGAWWKGSVGLAIYWNSYVPAEVFAELQRNPWQIFAPETRRIYFGAGGGTTAYNLDAQPGGYTVSGTAATLLRGIVLDAQPATYTVSGTAASIVRGYNLNAATGTFTATGAAATLLRGLSVNAAPGSFSVSGVDATLEYTQPGAYTLDAQPGSYSLTGVAATLTYTPLNAYTLDAQPASYVITGAAATLTYAGASIWTDVGVSAATWSDVGAASSIWTDL